VPTVAANDMRRRQSATKVSSIGEVGDDVRRMPLEVVRSAEFRHSLDNKHQLEGWLRKWTSTGWKKRWFVLHDRFLSHSKMKPRPKGLSNSSKEFKSLNLWTVKHVDVDSNMITIVFQSPKPRRRAEYMPKALFGMDPDRMFLRAKDQDMAQRWVQAMYSGPLDGRTKNAFCAEGAVFTAPKDTELQVDALDTTSRRDQGLNVQALTVLGKDGTTVQFHSKRLLASTSIAIGAVGPQCTLSLQLVRGKEVVGQMVSAPLEQYRKVGGKMRASYCVVLYDGSISKDAIKVMLKQDTIQATVYTFSRLDNLFLKPFIAGLSIAVLFALSYTKCALFLSLCSLLSLVGVVWHNQSFTWLSGVQIISMHEARVLSSRRRTALSRASTKSTQATIQNDPVLEEDPDEIMAGARASNIGQGAKLTQHEVAALQELRALCSDLLEDEEPQTRAVHSKYIEHDFRLVRFLRARNLNIRKANALLRKSLRWRVEFGTETLVKSFQPETWLLDYCFPDTFKSFIAQKASRLPFYFTDREGHLLLFIRAGLCDFRSVYKKLDCDGERLFKIGVWVFQFLLEDLELNYLTSNEKITPQIQLVIDLEGFKISRQIPINESVKLVRKYLTKLLDAFPEILGRVRIINAPWLFNSVWSMFTPFLPQRILDKVSITGLQPTKIQSLIASTVDASQTPVAYGGSYQGPDGDPYCMFRIPCPGPYREDQGLPFLC